MARLSISRTRMGPRASLALLLFAGLSAAVAAALPSPSSSPGPGEPQKKAPARTTVLHDDGESDAYILARGEHTMSTNTSLEEIEAMRRRVSGDFLWVRRADRESLIRDARTLQEAQALFEPLRQLDPERDALRRRQERIQSEQAALEGEEERLEEQLQELEDARGHHEDSDAGDDDDDDRSRPQAEESKPPPPRLSKEELSRLEAEQEKLSRRRTEIDLKVRAMESREHELESAEEALERRSDALEEKAEAALDALIDRALAKGLGRTVSF